MAGATDIHLIDTVATAEDDTLASLPGNLSTNSDYLASMVFPVLGGLGALVLNPGQNANSPLVTVSFPQLTNALSGGVSINGFNGLITINLPSLNTISNCGSLQTISLNAFTTDNTGGINIDTCGVQIINLSALAAPTGQVNFTTLNQLTTLTLTSLANPAMGLQIGNVALASISIPSLVTVGNGLFIHDNPNMLTIAFANLVTAAGGLNYTNMPLAGTVTLPKLTTVPFASSGDSVTISNNTMTEMDFPLLTTVANVFDVDNCSNLVTLHIPVLNSATQVQVVNNAALTTVTFPASWGITNISFNGCALTQTMVDNILIALVAGAQNNGTVDLSGGTSATPGPTGVTAAATLTANVWTVTTN
jgi:hypothetical protein